MYVDVIEIFIPLMLPFLKTCQNSTDKIMFLYWEMKIYSQALDQILCEPPQHQPFPSINLTRYLQQVM